MVKRMCIVLLSLVGLLTIAQVQAIGPNFYLTIDNSFIGYYAFFSVSNGNPVWDMDAKTDPHDPSPGGDEFHFSDTSLSDDGVMIGTIHSEVWWDPAISSGVTQVSNSLTYLALDGETTSNGTATATGLTGTAWCNVTETGTAVSSESWQIAIGYCALETLVAGAVSNGSGAASASITWGPNGNLADIASGWTSSGGYTTVGFYMIDDVPEYVDDDSSGLTATATTILQTKGSSSPGNTNGAFLDHFSSVSANGSIGNNGGIGLEGYASTSTGAYGIAP